MASDSNADLWKLFWIIADGPDDSEARDFSPRQLDQLHDLLCAVEPLLHPCDSEQVRRDAANRLSGSLSPSKHADYRSSRKRIGQWLDRRAAGQACSPSHLARSIQLAAWYVMQNKPRLGEVAQLSLAILEANGKRAFDAVPLPRDELTHCEGILRKSLPERPRSNAPFSAPAPPQPGRPRLFALFSSFPEDLPPAQKQLGLRIASSLGTALARTAFVVLNSGSGRPACEALCGALRQALGSPLDQERLLTYIPRNRADASGNAIAPYRAFGRCVLIENYPTLRRSHLVGDCNVIVALGGSEGTANTLWINERLYSRPVIPIPLCGGEAENHYQVWRRRLSAESGGVALGLADQIGDVHGSPESIAEAVVSLAVMFAAPAAS